LVKVHLHGLLRNLVQIALVLAQLLHIEDLVVLQITNDLPQLLDDLLVAQFLLLLRHFDVLAERLLDSALSLVSRG